MHKEVSVKSNLRDYQYYTIGSGEVTLLMLHGIAASKEFMVELATELKDNFHCILPDVPGHNGLSLQSITTFHELVGYFRHLVCDLQLKDYYIVGYSLGGLIGLKYAELFENDPNFKGLAVWSSPVLGFNSGISSVVKGSVPVIKSIPKDIFQTATQSKKLNDYINKALKFAGVYGEVPLNPLLKFKLADALEIIDFTTAVDFEINTQVPKLFIFDKYDPVVSVKNYEYVSKEMSCPHSRCVLTSRSGHFKNVEGFNKVKTEIKAFLKEHGAEGGI